MPRRAKGRLDTKIVKGTMMPAKSSERKKRSTIGMGTDGTVLDATYSQPWILPGVTAAQTPSDSGIWKPPIAGPVEKYKEEDQEPTTLRACPSYRFGDFGGRFAPELQMDGLQGLTVSFEKIRLDGAFCEGLCEGLPFNNTVRPSPLQLAKNLTLLAGGASIWLKREDLCEYGSENTMSILGQILLAQRIGKTEIVTECGSANHGIVCAKTCECLMLSCTIFMAESDANSQAQAIRLMRMFGASVVLVQANNDMGTLRSALNEAIRHSLCRTDSAYHVMCGPIGPHPLPTITRHFQSTLGEETKAQFAERNGGHLPDAIVSPVGTGCGAVGMFYPFIQCEEVQLVGVEAMEAAPLSRGSVGVLYGCKTYVLQNTDGQILPSRSAAPDMALPVAGPELAHWRSTKRVTFVTESDYDAFDGIELLREQEGILAGLSTGYAISKSMSLARELGAEKHIVLLVNGGQCTNIA